MQALANAVDAGKHTPFDEARDQSGVRLRQDIERQPIEPHSSQRAHSARRGWERFISKEEVLLLLEEGRTIDLMARLMEAHQAMPHDLEVLRSLRVLAHYVHERFDIDV